MEVYLTCFDMNKVQVAGNLSLVRWLSSGTADDPQLACQPIGELPFSAATLASVSQD
jgi:hypothetical protein